MAEIPKWLCVVGAVLFAIVVLFLAFCIIFFGIKRRMPVKVSWELRTVTNPMTGGEIEQFPTQNWEKMYPTLDKPSMKDLNNSEALIKQAFTAYGTGQDCYQHKDGTDVPHYQSAERSYQDAVNVFETVYNRFVSDTANNDAVRLSFDLAYKIAIIHEYIAYIYGLYIECTPNLQPQDKLTHAAAAVQHYKASTEFITKSITNNNLIPDEAKEKRKEQVKTLYTNMQTMNDMLTA